MSTNINAAAEAAGWVIRTEPRPGSRQHPSTSPGRPTPVSSASKHHGVLRRGCSCSSADYSPTASSSTSSGAPFSAPPSGTAEAPHRRNSFPTSHGMAPPPQPLYGSPLSRSSVATLTHPASRGRVSSLVHSGPLDTTVPRPTPASEFARWTAAGMLPGPADTRDQTLLQQTRCSSVGNLPAIDLQRIAILYQQQVGLLRCCTLCVRRPDDRAPVTSPEGYTLDVTPQGVRLVARTDAGLFYGAMTLAQLLSPDDRRGAVAIATLHIDDQPRFPWRGLMLDSARHMQTIGEIETLIDQMAQHKLNTFHWHLADDQGWRIEIRRYPQLTAIGAWRTPIDAGHDGQPLRYGGFYTQDQIRQLVAFAADRHVTVVPEIDMPGHAQAAVAAYPSLGVTGRQLGVSEDWGVHPTLYNVDDATLAFMDNVLDEVMALFPSHIIHVGGDEAVKDQWKASPAVQARMHALGLKDEDALQAWFIGQLGRHLAAHGRQLIGWDEILQGPLPPGATVMSWRGTQGAIDAARLGHDVVLATAPDLYFDQLQSDRTDEIAGRLPAMTLASIYAFKPVPAALDASQASHVLGAQANVWTEHMPTMKHVTQTCGAAPGCIERRRQGTCGYMAPEVLMDLPYNEKVDIYSFGIVMYEVFGRMLLLAKYERSQLEAIQAKIANGFRWAQAPPGLDPRIWNLVTQCWAQDPVERPTMEMVLRQLEDIADADGQNPRPSNTGAHVSPAVPSAGHPAARHTAGRPANAAGAAPPTRRCPTGPGPSGSRASPRGRRAVESEVEARATAGSGGPRGVAGGPSRRGVMFHGQAEDEHGLEPPARVPGSDPITSHRQQAHTGQQRTRGLLQTLGGSAAAAPRNRSAFSKVHPQRPQQRTASASAALAKDTCTVLRHLQACSHRATTDELDAARGDAARPQSLCACNTRHAARTERCVRVSEGACWGGVEGAWLPLLAGAARAARAASPHHNVSAALAAIGLLCMDIDVFATSDNALVVGHPSALHAALAARNYTAKYINPYLSQAEPYDNSYEEPVDNSDAPILNRPVGHVFHRQMPSSQELKDLGLLTEFPSFVRFMHAFARALDTQGGQSVRPQLFVELKGPAFSRDALMHVARQAAVLKVDSNIAVWFPSVDPAAEFLSAGGGSASGSSTSTTFSYSPSVTGPYDALLHDMRSVRSRVRSIRGYLDSVAVPEKHRPGQRGVVKGLSEPAQRRAVVQSQMLPFDAMKFDMYGPSKDVPTSLLQQVAGTGKPVVWWTVNSKEVLSLAVDMGVESIISDQPVAMLALIKTLKEENGCV
ncbi:MAG: hypothetical protein WDW38_004746 [Sanguina aurantia]